MCCRALFSADRSSGDPERLLVFTLVRHSQLHHCVTGNGSVV